MTGQGLWLRPCGRGGPATWSCQVAILVGDGAGTGHELDVAGGALLEAGRPAPWPRPTRGADGLTAGADGNHQEPCSRTFAKHTSAPSPPRIRQIATSPHLDASARAGDGPLS